MWLWRNILLFSNWYRVYLGGLQLKLRAGPYVQLHHRGDIALLWEVFGFERYGCVKEAAPESILDLGAHIGSFSLYAHALFPKARIYAYEPASAAFNTLVTNVGSFATVSKQAVAGTARPATLYITTGGVESQSGLYLHLHSEEQDPGFSIARTETVDCVTLDSILEMVGYVDFVKVDVEEIETEVLRNSQLLSSKVGSLVAECQPEILIPILASKGFDSRIVSGGHIYAVNRSKKAPPKSHQDKVAA